MPADAHPAHRYTARHDTRVARVARPLVEVADRAERLAASLPDTPVATAAGEAVLTAVGRRHRSEPTAPRTGGPAGNARLTAWTGLVLLVLFAVEGVTLLSIHTLISVHIIVGALLVPPVLLKTATTGWRIVRYYLGSRAYHEAGPPPLVLRLVGPLVILTTLAVLATGIWLVLAGTSSRLPFMAPLGFGVSVVTLHQASVIGWFAMTTIHVLGRTVPALLIVRRRDPRPDAPKRLPGGVPRFAVLGLALALGVGGSAWALGAAGDWTTQFAHRQPFPGAFPDGDHR